MRATLRGLRAGPSRQPRLPEGVPKAALRMSPICFWMPALVAINALAACPLPAQTWLKSPQRRTIAVSTATFYSGPKAADYACGLLSKGTPVDVYGHTDDGWLAIRPPAGSFCWVLANSVTATDQPDIYHVTRQGTIAWIGTTLATPRHYRWQVRLRPGEEVVVLDGGKPVSGPIEGAPNWMMIEPPAGEFRWVRADDLVSSQVAQAGHWKTAHTEAGRTAGASVEPARFEALEAAPLTRGPAPDGRSGVTNATSSRDRDLLVSLKAELASELARPQQSWKLGPLLARAERLSQSPDGDVRRDAFELEQSVLELQRLQQKARGLDSQTRLARAAGNSGQANRLEQLEFDGIGYLVPVHSRRQGVPPFALLDDQNEIVSLVRPSPGLKLHRYANRKVGIYGARHGVPSSPPVLTARRVVVLKDSPGSR